jgi:hypothetical protein
MKTIKELKCIGLNDKLPKGFRYIKSWEIEYLLFNNFKIFYKLEKHIYYKIINSKNQYRLLWLHRLVNNSDFYGNLRILNNYGRVRGVLICKK